MKKLSLIVLVVAAIAGHFSLAASVSNDSLLTLRVEPMGLAGGVTTKIVIDKLGNVEATKCQAIYPNPCRSQSLGRLSRLELRQISFTLAHARRESLSFPEDVANVCAAVPYETARYSADNDTLLLNYGSRPCGGDVIARIGNGTEKLLRVLDNYFWKIRD